MMEELAHRLAAALERFDAANRADPHRELFEGHEQAKELVYAWRMSGWLDRLAPEASEPLRLAARCQHLCRWMIPRDRYPMTRGGYRQWRTELAKFHAGKAAEILRDVGYDEATIVRVGALVRKENLAEDAEVQLLEDVICLVFLENYLDEFAREHEEDKVVSILRKTWRKMSSRGQRTALELSLPPEVRRLVEKALSGQ
jgi:hypothetical protein